MHELRPTVAALEAPAHDELGLAIAGQVAQLERAGPYALAEIVEVKLPAVAKARAGDEQVTIPQQDALGEPVAGDVGDEVDLGRIF